MAKRKYLFIVLSIPFMALCQKPYTDSKTYSDKPLVTPSFNKLPSNLPYMGNSIFGHGYNTMFRPFNNIYIPQPIDDISQRFVFDTNRYRDQNSTGIIKQFDNNYIIGSGEFSNLPLIGTIRRANIFYIHTLGKWTLSAGISATKYNLVPGIYNNFGFSGALNYAVNEKLSFSVFGSYYTHNSFHSAAALPYLSNSRYGASVSVAFNETIGLTLGAQRYFDPYSRRWITAPIIAPSFKIGKTALEIDLGGLLRLGLDNLYYNKGPKNNGNSPALPKTPVLQRRADMIGR